MSGKYIHIHRFFTVSTFFLYFTCYIIL